MRNKILSLIFFLFWLSSCSVLSELTKFDMPFDQSVTIQKTSIIANKSVGFTTPDIETKSADFLSKNNIKTDMVDKITLRKLEFEITSPTTGNFDFIKSVSISILSDSLPEINVASLSKIPAGTTTTLDLSVYSTDLKQYILKEKIKLKIAFTANQTIPSDYIMDVKPTFLMDFKVLGL